MSAMKPQDRPQSSEKNSKRMLHDNVEKGPPQKKRRQLLELEDSSEEGDAGVEDREQILGDDFHVNKEFAKRFEYNKKREELSKCEELIS